MLDINANCSNTFDKVEVWWAYKHTYRDNGIGFYVRFVGRNGNNTQMKIISGVDEPLTGTNLTFTHYKAQNVSDALFYEAIPFEMLRTHETEPQVIV